MDSSVPGNPQVINAVQTKVVYNQGRRHVMGFCSMISFMTLLGGLVLAIIAIVKDDLTKVTFYGVSTHYSEYCGWHNMHSYNDYSGYTGSPYYFKYSHYCSGDDKACTLEKVGKAFFSLLIIGIAFGGFALIAFMSDVYSLLTYLFIILCEFIFFACMLADALIWGLFKTCSSYCRNLSFPGLPNSITGCKSEFGASWILVVIAGGLALLSMKFLTYTRCCRDKRY